MPRFSPNLIATSIVLPLRHFFGNVQNPTIMYDDDPKKTKIEISAINNFFKIPIQEKPRISVDRGPVQITGVGLADNMAEQTPLSQTLGLTHKVNLVRITGEASVIIDARSEGVCELITDMVSHFLAWTSPILCDSIGFQQFALPMQISPCAITKVDEIETFQTTISIPYSMDERWQVDNDALKIKDMLLTFDSNLQFKI